MRRLPVIAALLLAVALAVAGPAPAGAQATTAPATAALDEVAADLRRDPTWVPRDALAVASYLAVPVIGRSGCTIGVLAFGHTAPGVFTEETERLIAGVAATAAIVRYCRRR